MASELIFQRFTAGSKDTPVRWNSGYAGNDDERCLTASELTRYTSWSKATGSICIGWSIYNSRRLARPCATVKTGNASIINTDEGGCYSQAIHELMKEGKCHDPEAEIAQPQHKGQGCMFNLPRDPTGEKHMIERAFGIRPFVNPATMASLEDQLAV